MLNNLFGYHSDELGSLQGPRFELHVLSVSMWVLCGCPLGSLVSKTLFSGALYSLSVKRMNVNDKCLEHGL